MSIAYGYGYASPSRKTKPVFTPSRDQMKIARRRICYILSKDNGVLQVTGSRASAINDLVEQVDNVRGDLGRGQDHKAEKRAIVEKTAQTMFERGELIYTEKVDHATIQLRSDLQIKERRRRKDPHRRHRAA